MEQFITLNQKQYCVIRLLGKGKGGYSYLVQRDNQQFVLKKIHHEPCSYYSFGDKLASEINDYQRLKSIGIPLAELYEIDYENEMLLKEYIDGPTIFDLVQQGQNVDIYIDQMRQICKILKQNNLNIDYFPTNFIAFQNQIIYIDYECNNYMEEWNFENWGKLYWSQTKEFIDYLNNLER